MENNLIPISQAAELLGVSIDTLRRWDESGKFLSTRNSEAGHRYYSKESVDLYLNDLLKIATEWVANGGDVPEHFFCRDSSVFQGRLSKLQLALSNVKDENIQNKISLLVAVAGEIGNNSFDHNLGNWPDVAGLFFAYDINKKQIILADRGVGILKTLSRVRPELKDDKTALKVALTEIVSGRAPEERGNGLKFVRKIVEGYNFNLHFQTGNAEININADNKDLFIKLSQNNYRGIFARLTW